MSIEEILLVFTQHTIKTRDWEWTGNQGIQTIEAEIKDMVKEVIRENVDDSELRNVLFDKVDKL
jgi:flagellar basal body-associated protein FliL